MAVDLEELYLQTVALVREQFTDAERVGLIAHLDGMTGDDLREQVDLWCEDIQP